MKCQPSGTQHSAFSHKKKEKKKNWETAKRKKAEEVIGILFEMAIVRQSSSVSLSCDNSRANP